MIQASLTGISDTAATSRAVPGAEAVGTAPMPGQFAAALRASVLRGGAEAGDAAGGGVAVLPRPTGCDESVPHPPADATVWALGGAAEGGATASEGFEAEDVAPAVSAVEGALSGAGASAISAAVAGAPPVGAPEGGEADIGADLEAEGSAALSGTDPAPSDQGVTAQAAVSPVAVSPDPPRSLLAAGPVAVPGGAARAAAGPGGGVAGPLAAKSALRTGATDGVAHPADGGVILRADKGDAALAAAPSVAPAMTGLAPEGVTGVATAAPADPDALAGAALAGSALAGFGASGAAATAAQTGLPPVAATGLAPLAMTQGDWPVTLASASIAALTPEGGTMILELTPEDLGLLRVTLTVDGDTATVQFQTETPEAARLLSEAERQLSQEFSRSGVTLTGHDARSDTASGNGSGRGGLALGRAAPDAPPAAQPDPLPLLAGGVINLIA